jgi:2-polyprenyl-6-hydroxyphenyl methylase / 3-demethylubiquinone-9 3-methyltransferase
MNTATSQVNSQASNHDLNHDPSEIAHFEQSAQRWWDKDGEFRPLHEINPTRVEYIAKHAELNGKRVLDIGCGGGLVSEALAQRGAKVSGIDLGSTAIEVATLHSLQSGLNIDYRCESAEAHAANNAANNAGQYDVIVCLEMLEHVPDPLSVIRAASQLIKPNGHVFFSTLNRTLKSYVVAVLGAEYVMNLLPRGTHTYDRFIKPSELARWARESALEVRDVAGIEYNPLTHVCKISRDPSVNYLMHTTKSA